MQYLKLLGELLTWDQSGDLVNIGLLCILYFHIPLNLFYWRFFIQAASYPDPRDACAAIAGESYKLWLEHENRTDDITIIIVHVKDLRNVRIFLPLFFSCLAALWQTLLALFHYFCRLIFPNCENVYFWFFGKYLGQREIIDIIFRAWLDSWPSHICLSCSCNSSYL